jgi:hypothetical protein
VENDEEDRLVTGITTPVEHRCDAPFSIFAQMERKKAKVDKRDYAGLLMLLLSSKCATQRCLTENLKPGSKKHF